MSDTITAGGVLPDELENTVAPPTDVEEIGFPGITVESHISDSTNDEEHFSEAANRDPLEIKFEQLFDQRFNQLSEFLRASQTALAERKEPEPVRTGASTVKRSYGIVAWFKPILARLWRFVWLTTEREISDGERNLQRQVNNRDDLIDGLREELLSKNTAIAQLESDVEIYKREIELLGLLYRRERERVAADTVEHVSRGKIAEADAVRSRQS